MSAMTEYAMRVADDEFAYHFPSGWTMEKVDLPEEPRITFRIREDKPGGQYGAVQVDRHALEQTPPIVKLLVYLEFKAIRQAFDDPAGQKKLQADIRNAERNAAALAAVRGMAS